jgi:hypothetical protein
MNSPSILEDPRLADSPLASPPPAPRASGGLVRGLASFTAGWAWRIFAAAFCAMNVVLAVALAGWLARWMEGRVLYGWWKRSGRASRETFAQFSAGLDLDRRPVTRPRWLLREHFREALFRSRSDGSPPGAVRVAWRFLTGLVGSLVSNFAAGVRMLAGTWLLTGWGCLLMAFSWEYGWLNSFHKGYEQHLLGLLLGVSGTLLLMLSLFYVPLAQVHHAATRELRSFLDIRFVWALVRMRPFSCLLLAAVYLLFGHVLEGLKTLAPALPVCDLPSEPTPEELRHVLHFLQQYYFAACFLLIAGLLATHGLAAGIYRSAVVDGLRRGWLSQEQLHPTLADWLARLDLIPSVAPAGPVWRVVGPVLRMPWRIVLGAATFLVWLAFVIRVYPGEFLNYHPGVGFLNHSLVQLPCFNYVPEVLEKEVRELERSGAIRAPGTP